MVTKTRVLGGRYVLGEVLGTGGMATVWRAADEVLGRQVAVKVFSPQFAADAGFMARFEREARHAAQMSHPRLVMVFDFGIDNGTAFIVTELVAGRTLRQVLDDAGILPPAQAVGIAAAVCEALEVAHAASLVHRGIKPANIVVSGGEVKVLDLGIARADGSADGTPTVATLGTAAYLSPEQASGDLAGPQSDLYSLGCVLFEMLTGERPFRADSARLAYRHIHDDPEPPSARHPWVPVQLDGIITQLLAKDPAARPVSAAAARADLLAALNPGAAAVLATAHEDVGPAGLTRRRFRPTRVEGVLAGALAAALAALVGVLLTGSTGHAALSAAPSVSHHSSTSPTAADKPAQPANLLAGPKRPAPPGPEPSARPAPKLPARPGPESSARPAPKQPAVRQTLPPVAAAAATFVGDLDAGISNGQVAEPAGQDLYNHLQHLLFGPPDQTTQQVQQQYAQLLRSYDQHRQQGQITGHAAIALRSALRALGAAVGAA